MTRGVVGGETCVYGCVLPRMPKAVDCDTRSCHAPLRRCCINSAAMIALPLPPPPKQDHNVPHLERKGSENRRLDPRAALPADHFHEPLQGEEWAVRVAFPAYVITITSTTVHVAAGAVAAIVAILAITMFTTAAAAFAPDVPILRISPAARFPLTTPPRASEHVQVKAVRLPRQRESITITALMLLMLLLLPLMLPRDTGGVLRCSCRMGIRFPGSPAAVIAVGFPQQTFLLRRTGSFERCRAGAAVGRTDIGITCERRGAARESGMCSVIHPH